MSLQYKNFTLQECDNTLAQHKDAIAAGVLTFWQKFTCEQCWQRVRATTPNKLFTVGHCRNCGHYTDLKKDGCNYSLMISRREPVK